MRQLLLLALLLLSSLHLSSSSRNGRGLQQARTQYFNAGWTIRGYCGATFLNGFETKLAEATKTDIQAYTKAADVTLVSTSECQEAQASWDSKQSFVTWVLSFKYTGTTDQNTALLRAARRNRGYGKPDPSVFPSVIALPQTLPKHVGGRTRTLRSNWATSEQEVNLQSFMATPAQAKTPVTIATCAKTSSNTAFVCSSGTVLRSNASSIRNPSQDNCCQAVVLVTCANVGNNTAYVCPSGQVLRSNPSTLSGTSLNATFCCQAAPTCATAVNGTSPFACPSGFALRSNASVILNPDTAACCALVPTCANIGNGTAFNCSAGFSLRTNATNVTTLTQAACCAPLPTCATSWNCTAGTEYRANATNITTGFSNSVCCQASPTCATAVNGTSPFVCPSGQILRSNASAILRPNATACCMVPVLTCANATNMTLPFICASGTTLRPNPSNITTPTQATCCVNSQTCAAQGANNTPWTCPTGYALRANASAITTISSSTCCARLELPSCAALTPGSNSSSSSGNSSSNATTAWVCPSGFQLRPNASSITTLSNATCCEPLPTCNNVGTNSTSFICPGGTVLRPNASVITVTPGDPFTAAACCMVPPTCATWMPPAAGVITNVTTNITNGSNSTTANNGTTANDGTTTPAVPGFICPVDYVPKATYNTSTNVSLAGCCDFVPTCANTFSSSSGTTNATRNSSSNSSCPVGSQRKANAAAILNPNVTNCCEPIPTCGNSGSSGGNFSCPFGYTLVANASNVTNPSNSSCCYWIPTCASLNGNATNNSYICPSAMMLRANATNVTSIGVETCCEPRSSCDSGQVTFYSSTGSIADCRTAGTTCPIAGANYTIAVRNGTGLLIGCATTACPSAMLSIYNSTGAILECQAAAAAATCPAVVGSSATIPVRNAAATLLGCATTACPTGMLSIYSGTGTVVECQPSAAATTCPATAAIPVRNGAALIGCAATACPSSMLSIYNGTGTITECQAAAAATCPATGSSATIPVRNGATLLGCASTACPAGMLSIYNGTGIVVECQQSATPAATTCPVGNLLTATIPVRNGATLLGCASTACPAGMLSIYNGTGIVVECQQSATPAATTCPVGNLLTATIPVRNGATLLGCALTACPAGMLSIYNGTGIVVECQQSATPAATTCPVGNVLTANIPVRNGASLLGCATTACPSGMLSIYNSTGAILECQAAAAATCPAVVGSSATIPVRNAAATLLGCATTACPSGMLTIYSSTGAILECQQSTTPAATTCPVGTLTAATIPVRNAAAVLVGCATAACPPGYTVRFATSSTAAPAECRPTNSPCPSSAPYTFSLFTTGQVSACVSPPAAAVGAASCTGVTEFEGTSVLSADGTLVGCLATSETTANCPSGYPANAGACRAQAAGRR